jgi:hypothetical protein
MKRFAFYSVLILVNLIALELLLSVYFFQRRGDYPSAIVHYATYQLQRVWGARLSGEQPIGIYKDDPELGFDHVANSSGSQRGPEFEVTYTIGKDLERLIPVPPNPRGRIYFLGCSYTFGWGVEDHQSYPYVLATRHWTSWEIRNRSSNGWGTAHAYLVLRKELETLTSPAIFVYSMIPDHIPRNYIRTEWLQSLAKSNRKHPHFELSDGKLTYLGTVGAAESRAGDDEVRRKEVQLTVALLVAMNRLASEHKLPFYVVLLPQKHRVAWGWNDWPPAIIRALVENRIPFVDLTEMHDDVEYFKQDAHPSPKGHEIIAAALSRSIIGDALRAP